METRAENRPCGILLFSKKDLFLVPTYHHPGHRLERNSRLARGRRGAAWIEWSGDDCLIVRLGSSWSCGRSANTGGLTYRRCTSSEVPSVPEAGEKEQMQSLPRFRKNIGLGARQCR